MTLPPSLLFSLTALAVVVLLFDSGASITINEDDCLSMRIKIPVLLEQSIVRLQTPKFIAENFSKPGVMCGIECQRKLPEPRPAELEWLLSYETDYENGRRTFTKIQLEKFRELRNTSSSVVCNTGHLKRRKRQVYGMDRCFVITDKHYNTNYPFSASVRLSTGCSGILVSPKHVLTSAHCVHNGQVYLNGTKKLRVGVMTLCSKSSRRCQQRGRRKGNKVGYEDDVATELDHTEHNRKRKNRIRHDTDSKSRQPMFRWTHVKLTQVPTGWMRRALVFSGHQWVDVDGIQKDYNVAVKITPTKYAQICHWIHGEASRCKLA